MEIVPKDAPEHEVREEINSRTHRAGYTTRSGGPVQPKIMSRPASNAYRENYRRIFGHD